LVVVEAVVEAVVAHQHQQMIHKLELLLMHQFKD
jgi:hypothetical protein